MYDVILKLNMKDLYSKAKYKDTETGRIFSRLFHILNLILTQLTVLVSNHIHSFHILFTVRDKPKLKLEQNYNDGLSEN